MSIDESVNLKAVLAVLADSLLEFDSKCARCGKS
jgi:hypothetical protein